MLIRISQNIVSFWIKEKIIEQGNEEAYVYGMQLLFSTVINVLIIAIISVLTNRPIAWVHYLVGFVPIRITAGGFHAKTPLLCSMLFSSSYMVCIFFLWCVKSNFICPWIITNCILSFGILYLYSPQPVSNKPMAHSELEKNRRISLIISIVILGLLYVSIQLRFSLVTSLCISIGELIASLFCAFAGKQKYSDSH